MYVDTLVVGGGPTGLTLATYLPGTVCLVERDGIGGCHRVHRQRGLFAEHGPRVYSGSYVNVSHVLKDIGTSFDETFQPYAFSPEHIDGKRWFNVLSWSEMLAVSIAYGRYIIDPSYGKDVSVLDWCTENKFSAQTIKYLNTVCLFSDGADSTRYSLNEFLSGFDQHTIFGFYEPRRTNDKHLFPVWKKHLEKRGVTMMERANVQEILHHGGTAYGVKLDNGATIHAGRVVFAIPPAALVPILKESNLVEPGFDTFAKETKYSPYWSIAFHYDTPRRVLDHDGFKSTPWGLIYLEMPFENERYRVLSVAATDWDTPSPTTGKTLREHARAQTNDKDIAVEFLRQLDLPVGPVRATSPHGSYRDTAFVAAARAGYWPPALSCCDNLYTVGAHNGFSNYNFTSMETAVQNALAFCGKKRIRCAYVGDFIRTAALIAIAYGMYAVVTRTIP